MTSTEARRVGSCFVIGLALVVVCGMIACDASHIYAARRLLDKQAALESNAEVGTEHDLARVSHCAWKGDDEAQSFASCLRDALPTLTTGPGMYVGVVKTATLLSHRPDDKAVQTLALSTMDRLWDHYRRVDEPSFQMADAAAADLNQSVLYRAFHPAAYETADRSWVQRLDSVEVAINDPALATKQRERRFVYESQDALAYQAARARATEQPLPSIVGFRP